MSFLQRSAERKKRFSPEKNQFYSDLSNFRNDIRKKLENKPESPDQRAGESKNNFRQNNQNQLQAQQQSGINRFFSTSEKFNLFQQQIQSPQSHQQQQISQQQPTLQNFHQFAPQQIQISTPKVNSGLESLKKEIREMSQSRSRQSMLGTVNSFQTQQQQLNPSTTAQRTQPPTPDPFLSIFEKNRYSSSTQQTPHTHLFKRESDLISSTLTSQAPAAINLAQRLENYQSQQAQRSPQKKLMVTQQSAGKQIDEARRFKTTTESNSTTKPEFTDRFKIRQSSLSNNYTQQKVQDFQNMLINTSDNEFNELSRSYIEDLIKLSSIIMFKVKSSSFYKKDLQKL